MKFLSRLQSRLDTFKILKSSTSPSQHKNTMLLYYEKVKLYLSSYKVGKEYEKLKNLFKNNKRIGYISNALDSASSNPSWKDNFVEEDIAQLQDIGLEPEILDLRKYFGKQSDLRKKLDTLGGVWISGGNTFVLRQAYSLSGFDQLLLDELRKRAEFVYGGYSAACCVLSPSLKCYQIVDNPNVLPYEENKETLWDGLGILDFAFMPHFDSDHKESDDIGKEIELCKKEGIPYKALRDGEVLIL